MIQQTKILVVEDNIDLAEMLRAYLQIEGYAVKTTGWGEDAVQMVEEAVPDLITLDINLPDIDGYEVCRRLRATRPARHVPVIFLTEKRKREDKLAGLEMGAVDYITKPFDVQELSLRVGNALHRSRLRTLENPVTGLPEGQVVKEKLEKMLSRSEWAIIVAGLDGLDDFRDKYGFVAADDIVRAAHVLIKKAMDVSGAGREFVGQVDLAEFIVITTPARAHQLAENCLRRLETAIPYFYPAFAPKDKNNNQAPSRLSASVTTLTSKEHSITNFEELRAALVVA